MSNAILYTVTVLTILVDLNGGLAIAAAPFFMTRYANTIAENRRG
jgi:hypothetical protein